MGKNEPLMDIIRRLDQVCTKSLNMDSSASIQRSHQHASSPGSGSQSMLFSWTSFSRSRLFFKKERDLLTVDQVLCWEVTSSSFGGLAALKLASRSILQNLCGSRSAFSLSRNLAEPFVGARTTTQLNLMTGNANNRNIHDLLTPVSKAPIVHSQAYPFLEIIRVH